jgi:hypothetical protein
MTELPIINKSFAKSDLGDSRPYRGLRFLKPIHQKSYAILKILNFIKMSSPLNEEGPSASIHLLSTDCFFIKKKLNGTYSWQSHRRSILEQAGLIFNNARIIDFLDMKINSRKVSFRHIDKHLRLRLYD